MCERMTCLSGFRVVGSSRGRPDAFWTDLQRIGKNKQCRKTCHVDMLVYVKFPWLTPHAADP